MEAEKRGGFTLPGEAGYEKLTLQLAEKWGADVIRDSDGTQLGGYSECRLRNLFHHLYYQRSQCLGTGAQGLSPADGSDVRAGACPLGTDLHRSAEGVFSGTV